VNLQAEGDNFWFGADDRAPACKSLGKVKPPVGEICPHCGEAIAADDSGYVMPMIERAEVGSDAYVARMRAWHWACHRRAVVGSLGHQRGRCSCHGGSDEDPPDLSRREAARAASLYGDLMSGRSLGAEDVHFLVRTLPSPMKTAEFVAMARLRVGFANEETGRSGEVGVTEE
jgi:hypothetical protein